MGTRTNRFLMMHTAHAIMVGIELVAGSSHVILCIFTPIMACLMAIGAVNHIITSGISACLPFAIMSISTNAEAYHRTQNHKDH